MRSTFTRSHEKSQCVRRASGRSQSWALVWGLLGQKMWLELARRALKARPGGSDIMAGQWVPAEEASGRHSPRPVTARPASVVILHPELQFCRAGPSSLAPGLCPQQRQACPRSPGAGPVAGWVMSA